MLSFLRRRKTAPPDPLPAPVREPPRVHDYTRGHLGWGHDYVVHHDPDDLERLRVSGWGLGIERGDHLLIDYSGQRSRYEVAHIEYHRDPRDMWAADLTLIPPTEDVS
ncbi:hypothetical protein OG824_31610 [Streptomyces prunicolor]|uniref:hypothetical protein n=1 Tax=Streptomyces prunicolor TaxID=67348 RepID=UPI0022503434|nr:hypothetical protein [Streptomyces prunicolor]MCX5239757.1 hypothetical protein [Streptomyces prunicolor]